MYLSKNLELGVKGEATSLHRDERIVSIMGMSPTRLHNFCSISRTLTVLTGMESF